MRTVLFYRDIRKFRGGHLKTWHYFNHVLASPEFTPRIAFSAKTKWDASNPWLNAREHIIDWLSVHPDVFFVGGANWSMMDAHPAGAANLPVINLVQGVRHAEAATARYDFLERKAIRICVSDEVARAVTETGRTNGPVVVIPNGIDLDLLSEPEDRDRDIDLLIVAMKQPELGREAAHRLAMAGRRIELLDAPLPQLAFFDRLRRARTTLCLPLTGEGFYMPALEGMALGTVVVCPDCIGNRSFCLPGENAFRPVYEIEALVRDTEDALTLPDSTAGALRANARQMAEAHSLSRERAAFLDLLHNLDQLW